MAKPSFIKLTRIDIQNMSDYVLKATIKSVSKTVKSRMSRIKALGLEKYAYTFNAAENVAGHYGGKLTTATAGKTRAQLERLLQDWLSLYRVGETAGQVKQQYMNNIKNFFREPRFTKEFINELGDNIDALYDIFIANAQLIIDVLGSDRYQQGKSAYQSGDIQTLRDILQEVSDELDTWDESEKDDILKQFVTPDGWGDSDKWGR